jgi:hypothetical protein
MEPQFDRAALKSHAIRHLDTLQKKAPFATIGSGAGVRAMSVRIRKTQPSCEEEHDDKHKYLQMWRQFRSGRP